MLAIDSTNTFVGSNAGGSVPKDTDYNTFIGGEAGSSDTTGNFNTFVGSGSGKKNTTGRYNTFIGHHAGYNNITGSNNTALGYYAGHGNAGEGNVFLGYQAGANEIGSNKLCIANSNTSTPLVYGEFDNNTLTINGNVGINTVAYEDHSLYVHGSMYVNGDAYTSGDSWTPSDVRWKKNIRPLQNALEKISQIEGVTYEWKTDEYPDMGFDKGTQVGVIAQDIEPVLPELVNTDDEGYKAVSYEKLTPLLVEAIKEQQAQIKALQAQIEDLKSEIKALKE